MITERDINLTTLSTTKRDFYQIWNELLDTASKLSERWDPTSTNESDPGIVLLKILTACADKLNYNIDKNILEIFMPSATQEDSMRKLCEMLGYNIKYYQSATTDVTISFIRDLSDIKENTTVTIPAFSAIKNSDGTVVYITTEEVNLLLNSSTPVSPVLTQSVSCIEGEYITCVTENTANVITMANLDENFRYFLPETSIAENGIYIKKYITNASVTPRLWTKVENLNTQIPGSFVWKFGYDSAKQLPYIQFPEDINSLIEDGLQINYIRTSGANGNISARTLSTLEFTGTIKDISEADIQLSSADFTAINSSAATNGANIETIDNAYENFKKTIGTFDTLTTCRDYINKIYNLYEENIPLVSNIIVSDIRDDVNKSISLCEFSEAGICYVDAAKTKQIEKEVKGKDSSGAEHTIKITESKPLITNFDLVLYPFKTVYGLNNRSEFEKSFKYTEENKLAIEQSLQDYKTVSHIFTYPEKAEIVCIKNYLKLNAKITTTYKINSAEESGILSNIFINIYKNFNARKIDFGEEIPYESILNCIESADSRIKNVSLDEPVLYTKIMTADNNEYDYATEFKVTDTTAEFYKKQTGKKLYNSLALRNILAGRVRLFNYNNDFEYSFLEKKYWNENYSPIYPTSTSGPVIEMQSECLITAPTEDEESKVTLAKNEVISFRAPNFKTTVTYPGYVNYYLHLENKVSTAAIPATFIKFGDYLNTANRTLTGLTEAQINNAFSTDTTKTGYKYKITEESTAEETTYKATRDDDGDYIAYLAESNFATWFNIIKNQTYTYETSKTAKLLGIFRITNTSLATPYGAYRDANGYKYGLCDYWHNTTEPYNYYFVQETHESTEEPKQDSLGYTYDGLGRDLISYEIKPNAEYKLTGSEYLLINYIESASSSETESSTETIKNLYYGDGTIIRPNFEITDSETKHLTTSWSKTTGFDFKKYITNNPEGMFTLGANEQIEIREIVTIKLNKTPSYIYWTTSDTDTNFFARNEAPEGATYKERTLDANEYFYYTNEQKAEMAYYGNGTTIRYYGNKEIKKSTTADTISAETILENGIAAIPWIKCDFSSTDYIEIQEYQYINLTAGDTLKNIEIDVAETDPSKINNNWKTCKSASYVINGEASSLPTISVGTDAVWKVHSTLEFNLGPSLAQTLYKDDKKTDSITLYTYANLSRWEGKTEIKKLEPTKEHPLTLKSNYICQSNYNTVDTRVTKYTNIEDASTAIHIDDFKIKLFEQQILEIKNTNATSTKLDVGTFNNYWTKIPFSQFEKPEAYTILYNVLPSETANYSILMFYYIAAGSDITKYAYLSSSDSTPLTPVIFNNYVSAGSSETEAWWTGYVESNTKYHLRPGINIVKLTKSGSLNLYPDTKLADSVIISKLDMVNSDTTNLGLALDLLKYQAWDATQSAGEITINTSAAKQLLKDIRTIDLEYNFYYNCLLDNSTTIDINESETSNENLATEQIWYDYNNMNNKFVISEIDAETLASGIVIAKSSKL